jgi:hypothetical protein
MDVEQDDVDGFPSKELFGALDRRRLEHSITLELEIDAAQHSQAGVVVDNEHGVSRFPHVAGNHCTAESSPAMPVETARSRWVFTTKGGRRPTFQDRRIACDAG